MQTGIPEIWHAKSSPEDPQIASRKLLKKILQTFRIPELGGSSPMKMTDAADHDLIRDFASNIREESFRVLVSRHSSLVFGTAFRIVRDQHAAEEITQNVFIALARKACSLQPDTCLPAWLHRSAVLEAKNWVRGEVRRKQREQTAGGLMTGKDESLLAALSSVLDEALLDLREIDRAALLARFAQEQSLKEVGAFLGVSEDTAQKRVAKAIELLTNAFRRRGYKVPTAAVTLALLQSAAHSAPTGLIATTTAAALAASATCQLGTVAMLAAKFMSLTKTQTATVCLLLGAAPVAYQWQVNQQAYAEQRRAEQTATNQASILADLENHRSSLARQNIIAENELAALRANLNRAVSTPAPMLPSEDQLYSWSADSTHIRLPKSLLNDLRLTPRRELPGVNGEMIVDRGPVLDNDGGVSPVLLEALGLDAPQATSVQAAFIHFARQFDALTQAHTHLTNIMPPGVSMDRAANAPVVTLRTVAFPEQGAALQEELHDKLTAEIGLERTDIILKKQAAHDFQSDFLDFGKLDNWITAVRMPDGMYGIARAKSRDGLSTGASSSSGFPYENLPDEIKKFLPPPVTATP